MAVGATLGEGQVTQAARRKVLPVLRKLGGKATVGEVVQGTGLPAPEAAATLWTLVSELDGHVDVGSGGDVLFRFPPSLQKQTKSELWAQFWSGLYAIFKTGFKVGIMVVLAAYFLIFVLIAIAMMVAAIAGSMSRDGDSSEGWSSSDRHGSSFDFGDLFGWLWLTSDSRQSYQPYDRWQRSRGMSTHAPAPSKPSLPLYQKVVGYVFGDEEPAPDPAQPDREALAYVRDRGRGYLTATDILALRATRGTESAQIASRLAFTNGGYVEVTDDGTVLFRLEEIMSRLDRGRQSQGWAYAWEHVEPELKMNSNSAFFNFCVTAVNGFNLLFAGWFALSPDALRYVSHTIGVNLTGFQLVLGGVPFVFSVLFFLIPALRSLWVSAENGRRGERNRWRELVGRLTQRHVWARQAPPATAQLLDATPAELKQLAEAYGAREDGPGAYVFDRLRQEWAAVEAARKGVAHMKWRFGGKVFSTDDPIGTAQPTRTGARTNSPEPTEDPDLPRATA